MEHLSVILEDTIMQKGLPLTAGSKILESFVSPADATVVTRLNEAGADIVGRARVDEFGVGGLFNDAGAMTEAVKSVANGEADVALCNDYTGAVSRAAAVSGLYNIRPTYGTVSRYGLIPAVPSIDQIGIVCKDLTTGFNALSVIAGYDPKDGIMQPDTEKTHKQNDIIVTEVEPEYSDIHTQVMQILCCAEFANSISRYDGIKFGYRTGEYSGLDELYKKSRSEAFGADVKLTALIGAMVLSQENYTRYYDKAMRLRRLIKDSLDFTDYDVIKLTGGKTLRGGWGFVTLPILSGLPAVTTPEFTLIANAGNEAVLLSALEESGL